MRFHVESLVWRLGFPPEGRTMRNWRNSAIKVLQIAVVVGENNDYVFVSTSPDACQWNQNLFKIPKRVIQERFAICEAESTDQNLSLDFIISQLIRLTSYLLPRLS
jgi:hypothetical protein